jgi:hypothetical protein
MRPATLSAAALSSLASLAAFALGCGGSPAPLAPDTNGAKDGGVESFAEVNPADLAELDAGSAPAPAAEPAPAASAAAAPAAAAPPPDDCTPVGVDFEKRARPKLKECYATGKKKDPNLQGTVKLTVDIDTLGKIKSIKIVEKTLPDPVAQCMLKALKATPLTEASKCPGKSLTIPVTFPTPR